MSVTAAAGFVASGHASGIKDDGALDLALVATTDHAPVVAAGVFTANKMTAAPVLVSHGHLRASAGRASAVILNAGNANAGTGEAGERDAETTCALVAAELGCDPHHVLVCSTGLIGYRLPMELLGSGIAPLVAGLDEHGGGDAAEAIRTTDTVRKEVVVQGDGFVVGGMAKGAAMLAPNMATMLAVLTTDAAAESDQLHRALAAAVRDSFNVLSTDGCTSTNDTVLVLASGTGAAASEGALTAALSEACTSLAEQMAGDAEGATKVVRVEVVGAHSDDEAAIAAREVADSALCKCSWYGEDPYWGRIASELGSAGVHFDQRLVSISYGDVVVAHAGVEIDHDREAVAAHMAGRHLRLTADLGLGAGRAHILTNDLTHAYVDENKGTS